MIARKCTESELRAALDVVNLQYAGNVEFKKMNFPRFTLTVEDSGKKGGRIGFTGRKVKAACWHIHGHFFDALFKINPAAYVWSQGGKITKDAGNWQDRNIGSIMNPLMYSDACNCAELEGIESIIK